MKTAWMRRRVRRQDERIHNVMCVLIGVDKRNRKFLLSSKKTLNQHSRSEVAVFLSNANKVYSEQLREKNIVLVCVKRMCALKTTRQWQIEGIRSNENIRSMSNATFSVWRTKGKHAIRHRFLCNVQQYKNESVLFVSFFFFIWPLEFASQCIFTSIEMWLLKTWTPSKKSFQTFSTFRFFNRHFECNAVSENASNVISVYKQNFCSNKGANINRLTKNWKTEIK